MTNNTMEAESPVLRWLASAKTRESFVSFSGSQPTGGRLANNGESAISVSVVIPTYNYARYLGEAIESALAQSVRPLEVIVVDDGSTDDTERVAAAYPVRYVRKENGGEASARNVGVRAAQGEFIAFLDADDKWTPGKIERQLETAERTRAAVIHTDFMHWDGARTWDVPSGRAKFYGDCYRKFFWGSPGSTPTTFMVRRSCFDEIGLFREIVPGGLGVDLDMWLRLARRFQFAFVPEKLALKRAHGSNMTRQNGLGEESYFWVYRKALKADPKLAIELGKESIRNNLARHAYYAAYGYRAEGNQRKAARYFLRAAMLRPTNVRVWARWFDSATSGMSSSHP